MDYYAQKTTKTTFFKEDGPKMSWKKSAIKKMKNIDCHYRLESS
jgi:hypothetical protein